jgi:hypothetical protein
MGESMDLIDYLQGEGRHSIDVLLAIWDLSPADIECKPVTWKDVKEWFHQHGKNLSDATFRKRRDELEQLGLVRKESRDRFKFDVFITPKGAETATALKDLIAKLNIIQNEQNPKHN